MKARELSRREQGLIEDAVHRICRSVCGGKEDPDLRQSVWAAILGVYRDDPAAFRGGSTLGWQRAYAQVEEVIRAWHQAASRAAYQLRSLDQPLSRDTEATLLQLLHSPGGSFENSVCLREYLGRLPPDVQRMAQGLMDGDSPARLQRRYRWSGEQTRRTFGQLRRAMEHYLQI